MPFYKLTMCLLSFAATPPLDASLPVAAEASAPWQAEWLGLEDASRPNDWLCFRRTIELAEIPQHAAVRIACDSKYWLWINGRLIVFEGGLKRGPSPTGTYFDTVDLAPHLQVGPNTVAVLVWYFGKPGFSHNDSGRAALLFDAEIDGQPLGGEEGWRVLRHPAFGDTPAPHPNFRLSEANIRFDARLDLTAWTSPRFDDAAWAQPVLLGLPPVGPWGPLAARPIPGWRDSGLRNYENADEIPSESSGTAIVARLPYNAQVTPYLKIEAPAGLTIDLRTDDYDNFPNGPSVRAEYVTRAGVQEFECFGWMNGHEVHYTIPAGVRILALKYRETGYDADFQGSFECDDPALNELWHRSRRTLYVTMRDTYMDCPDRERAQWWGDEVTQLGESFYLFDPVRGPLLARKGIRELADWQRPDNVLFAPMPAGVPAVPGAGDKIKLVRDGSWDRELPVQILASVGWYGFWTYYRYTADRETIEAVYPAVQRYLAIWQTDADGLVVHRAGGWDWMDWGKGADGPVIENAWFLLALRGAAEMARLTGHVADAEDYDRQSEKLSRGFEATFWRGDVYRSDAVTRPDDRANALAVVAGLVPAERYPLLRKILGEVYQASPYMEKYVLEALFLMDAPGEALARMRRRYANMLADPITTLWENFGRGEDRLDRGTYNHSWSGGPLTLLSQYAAGVEPLSSGWSHVGVKPRMGDLRHINATVPLPQGLLGLTLDRTEATFALRLIVPESTRVTVAIPRAEADTDWEWISLDGSQVANEGDRSDEGRRLLELGPGSHSLAAGINPRD